jgi:hypothetical protein
MEVMADRLQKLASFCQSNPLDSPIRLYPALVVTARCGQRMAFQPQSTSGNGRINAGLFPPCRFIATAMNLAMMATAQGHSELITDFAAKRFLIA